MRVDTIVVGAGHAGLAVSRLLTDAGRDHVVFDRGRVAERWRSERWDSLHLLTPNWMTRLPGWCYTGPDPDGYLSSAELIQHLEGMPPPSGAPSSRIRPSWRSPPQHGPGVRSVPCGDRRATGTPVMSSSPQVPTAGPTCRPAYLVWPNASS